MSVSFATVRTTQAPAWLILSLVLGSAPLHGSPPLGTTMGLGDLLFNPAAIPHGSGWAIPVIAEPPGWYTATLRRRVIEAAGAPVAAPNDAPLPSEIGIRPGAWMVEPNGCTMNFVFEKDGGLLIGTAGHCVHGIGEHVVLLTLTPESREPVLIDIGTVVMRQDTGVGDDFALVSIRPELSRWVSATSALTGGPCGSYSGRGPETITHYGHGLVLGTGGTPRVGVALLWEDDYFGWTSPAIAGDSGSPVMVLPDLQAAGNLTHLVVDASWLPSFVAGTRIGKMLQALPGLRLADSPLCDPGDPPQQAAFIRGDSNRDRSVDLSDAIFILNDLFIESAGSSCPDAADADDTGVLEITDPIYLFNFLFLGGPRPPEPHPEEGKDPSEDGLGCRGP